MKKPYKSEKVKLPAAILRGGGGGDSKDDGAMNTVPAMTAIITAPAACTAPICAVLSRRGHLHAACENPCFPSWCGWAQWCGWAHWCAQRGSARARVARCRLVTLSVTLWLASTSQTWHGLWPKAYRSSQTEGVAQAQWFCSSFLWERRDSAARRLFGQRPVLPSAHTPLVQVEQGGSGLSNQLQVDYLTAPGDAAANTQDTFALRGDPNPPSHDQ